MNGLGTELLLDLIRMVFGIVIVMVMLRMILQMARADVYNPISQALVKITNPPLIPLRRIIPGLWGIDLASVVLMVALKIIEFSLIVFLVGKEASLVGLFIIATLDLAKLAIYIFLGAIFISIIISWISPQSMYQNPAAGLARNVSEPILRPARRILPPMAGFDFSPILVIFLLMTLLKIINRVF
jgi:YggT family protein